MDIDTVTTLVVEESRTRMAQLIAPVPIRDKADNLRRLCRLFQALGICKLISTVDINGFRTNLIRSAQARKYHLRKSREENNVDDRFLGISRVQSIFDAIVAGDVTLAREIAALSVAEWHETWEYEDDFCYYLFVHRLVHSIEFVDTDEATALIARFDRALEGQRSPRLALLRALQQRDASEFGEVFEAFLGYYQESNEAKRATITEYTAEAIFWPGSFVCVEALAWLRFAAACGIEPVDDFAFCPPDARRSYSPIAVPDLFDSLDQALSQG